MISDEFPDASRIISVLSNTSTNDHEEEDTEGIASNRIISEKTENKENYETRKRVNAVK